jgi:hypothetical protein
MDKNRLRPYIPDVGSQLYMRLSMLGLLAAMAVPQVLNF